MNADRYLLSVLRHLFGGAGPAPHRPQSAPNYRGDGYDQLRIDRAEAKRARRRLRNIERRHG